MTHPAIPSRRAVGAGADVDAFCSRCNLELAHVIIAMDGKKIVRVQCHTCKTVHAYRSGAPQKREPAQGGRRSAAISHSDYDKVMRGRDVSRAKPYRPRERFAVDDIVSHVTFGLGAVMKVLADDKIEVAFPIGIKVLVHGRN
ncbi:MAG: hypothetical protein HY903_03640 [Deltaproteobacteria bacterium]|nr:hypothetical protein [Deltaproteobacteria bacterium]